MLAAQTIGADCAYVGSAFIATHEASAKAAYKDMIVASKAADVVYSSHFTGVHGNYLAPSIAAAGLDPANLPEADKTTMNFASGGSSEAKAWRDIWGSGQGIGAVREIVLVAQLVARLRDEYEAAREAVAAGTSAAYANGRL